MQRALDVRRPVLGTSSMHARAPTHSPQKLHGPMRCLAVAGLVQTVRSGQHLRVRMWGGGGRARGGVLQASLGEARGRGGGVPTQHITSAAAPPTPPRSPAAATHLADGGDAVAADGVRAQELWDLAAALRLLCARGVRVCGGVWGGEGCERWRTPGSARGPASHATGRTLCSRAATRRPLPPPSPPHTHTRAQSQRTCRPQLFKHCDGCLGVKASARRQLHPNHVCLGLGLPASRVGVVPGGATHCERDLCRLWFIGSERPPAPLPACMHAPRMRAPPAGQQAAGRPPAGGGGRACCWGGRRWL